LVGPGIYPEWITVNTAGITLKGPNAGVAGNASRGPEAVLTAPLDTELTDPAWNETEIVLQINAPNVTVDGFHITGDNQTAKNNYAGFNIQAGSGIIAYED